MKIRSAKGLTFDDVLLVPKRSPIASRRDVDPSTRLTDGLRLNIPILSANMDTVTEAAMAMAMAREGGLGVIHRFMTIEQQVKQVERVKRAEGFVVEAPYQIDPAASLAAAARMMARRGVGGLVVKDDGDKLLGLITKRDVMLAPDVHQRVDEVMTSVDQIVSVGPEVSADEARRILYIHRIEKLPVLTDDGELVGLITAQDLMKPKRYPRAIKDEKGRLRVGAAIGVSAQAMERADALLAAGADVLVLDIAHGHADHCIDMVRALRRAHPDAQIVAGNVASADGARDLAEAGANAIKVGIGPGSICTTRIVTGFGVPQLTAIMDVAEGLRGAGFDIPIIADGGVKTSGDMVKALAAGASSVMIGSLFAGCEEAPGAPVIRDGRKVKVVRGMASLGAAISRKASEEENGEEDESAESQAEWDKVVPEGVEAVVPYRGHVREILYQMVGGLRSGMSYGGAFTIEELQRNAEFIVITPAGVRESHPHDVRRV